MNSGHSISEVSTRTGIPKDLLRMWERRYGFPLPKRDINDKRLYSDSQLHKLLLIRQLVDLGKRPGKLISLKPDELQAMLASTSTEFDDNQLIELLRAGDHQALRKWFEHQLQSHGLHAFVHTILAPATHAVGDAWANGTIAVYEEHLFSEIVSGQLRKAINEQGFQPGKPRVMLTTVPGEQHSLGLLMVEILMRLGGADVISFGTEMPFQQIREAATAHRVQIIALSFSASFKTEDALVMLGGLRQLLPAETGLWAGGAAFDSNPDMPPGVELADSLESVERMLLEWKLAYSEENEQKPANQYQHAGTGDTGA